MKKITILVFVVSCCVLYFIWSRTQEPQKYTVVKIPAGVKLQKGTVSAVEAQMSYDLNLTQVRNTSDAIIIGRPTQDFANRVFAQTYLPQDPDDADNSLYVSSEWTEGSFVIEQVLHQRSGHFLAPGQTITVAETVGVAVTPTGAFRSVIENCYELKQNKRYVLFVGRGDAGAYVVDNFNLGRFNTDGTDTEDEVGVTNGLVNGIKTDKQKLREELITAYGVVFVPTPTPSPTPAPLAITSLSPDNALAGAPGFTLTVSGTGFRTGAGVMFGTGRKPTTFATANRVTAIIPASDIAVAGTFPVTVVNTFGAPSASRPFTVRANPSSPHPRIVSAQNIFANPPQSWEQRAAPAVMVSVGTPRPAGTSLSVELQKAGSTTWAVVGTTALTATATTATVNEEVRAVVNGGALAGDSVRVRLVSDPRSSQYSNTFLLQVTQ